MGRYLPTYIPTYLPIYLGGLPRLGTLGTYSLYSSLLFTLRTPLPTQSHPGSLGSFHFQIMVLGNSLSSQPPPTRPEQSCCAWSPPQTSTNRRPNHSTGRPPVPSPLARYPTILCMYTNTAVEGSQVIYPGASRRILCSAFRFLFFFFGS